MLPACNPYRNRYQDETDAEYVQKRKDELVRTIEELGSEEVAGLILEPVVGAVSEVFFFQHTLFKFSLRPRMTSYMLFPRKSMLTFYTGAWLRTGSAGLSQSHERSVRQIWRLVDL
jgi:hypothetical protein